MSPTGRLSTIALIEEALADVLGAGGYSQKLKQVAEPRSPFSSDEPTIANLPVLTCEAVGGDSALAAPLAATWQLIRLAAKLFDDIEDGDVRSQTGQMLNVATGLLFTSQLVLRQLAARIGSDQVLRLSHALQSAMLRAGAGQDADLAFRAGLMPMDPDAWLQIAQAKSGELVGWASWAGAVVARADDETLAAVREYGMRLGVLLQLADDYNGIWDPSDLGDLVPNSPNLSLCYARFVMGRDERENLETLLRQAGLGDSRARSQCQKMLDEHGAQAYLLVVAQTQLGRAISALQHSAKFPNRIEPLIALLNQVFPAVRFVPV